MAQYQKNNSSVRTLIWVFAIIIVLGVVSGLLTDEPETVDEAPHKDLKAMYHALDDQALAAEWKADHYRVDTSFTYTWQYNQRTETYRSRQNPTTYLHFYYDLTAQQQPARTLNLQLTRIVMVDQFPHANKIYDTDEADVAVAGMKKLAITKKDKALQHWLEAIIAEPKILNVSADGQLRSVVDNASDDDGVFGWHALSKDEHQLLSLERNTTLNPLLSAKGLTPAQLVGNVFNQRQFTGIWCMLLPPRQAMTKLGTQTPLKNVRCPGEDAQASFLLTRRHFAERQVNQVNYRAAGVWYYDDDSQHAGVMDTLTVRFSGGYNSLPGEGKLESTVYFKDDNGIQTHDTLAIHYDIRPIALTSDGERLADKRK